MRNTAPYAAKEILHFAILQVKDTSGTVLPSLADDAIHLAAYFGDANGSQTYSSADALLLLRMASHMYTGLSACQLADPIVIGDVTQNGAIQSSDALVMLRMASHIPYATVPALPGLPLQSTGSPDPKVFIPQDLTGKAGDTITVPINLQVTDAGGITIAAADATLYYDSNKFDVSNVRLGTLLPTADFIPSFQTSSSGGVGEVDFSAISLTGTSLLTFNTTGSLYLVDFTVKPGAATGPSLLNLVSADVTDNNVIDLPLNPAPTPAWNDSVDGVLTISAGPTSTMTFPTAAYYNAAGWGAGTIQGSSSETGGPGVSSVQVNIENTTTGKWYDGSGFNASAVQWLATGGTTAAWTYPLTASQLTDGSSYTVSSQATDSGGTTQSTPTTTSFIYDTTAPASTISFPTAAYYNVAGWGTGTIQGGSSDPGGSGVSSVQVNIKDNTTGKWYDGSGFNASSVQWLTASGTTAWSDSLAASKLTDGSSYTVSSQATDAAGNTQSTPTTTSFIYDTTAPASTISFPTAAYYNVAGWGTGTIQGGSSDPGGSGVSSVQVNIKDNTTGKWYDGSGFNASSVQWLTASGTTAWSDSLAASKLTDGSSYTVSSQATDAAGNTQSTPTTTSFIYDTTAPASTISFPTAAYYNVTGWGTGTIQGGSSDPGGSGVSSVQVNIKDNTTGKWYDGSGFNASSVQWLTVSGTTTWTYALAGSKLSDGSSYTVSSQATDAAGNTQSTPTTTSFTDDTTAPASTISFPTAAYYNVAGWGTGTIQGGSSDPGGSGVSSVQVNIKDNTTGKWYDGSGFNASSVQWLTASGTTAWSDSLAASKLTDGSSYTVSSQATDAAGNTQSTPTTTSFIYDTTAPASTISFPTAAYYNVTGWGTGTIQGGSSDPGGSGVSSVQVNIKDNTTGKWYDGSGFNASSVQWLTVSGTTTWTYALAGSKLSDGSSYTVSSQATDAAGNTQSAAATASFTYDTTAPTAASFAPLPGSTNVPANTTLAVSFSENMAKGGSGNIVVKKAADNSVVTSIPVTSSQVTISNAQATIVTGVILAPATGYYVLIDAGAFQDLAGNAFAGITSTSAWSFTVSAVSPMSTITFPTAASYNVAGWGTGTIQGTSSETGGPGVGSVQVNIENTTTGKWYDGSGFNASAVQWLATGGTTAAWTYPLAASKLTDGSSYIVSSQATDALGITQSIPTSTSFIYDTTAPTIALGAALQHDHDGWADHVHGDLCRRELQQQHAGRWQHYVEQDGNCQRHSRGERDRLDADGNDQRDHWRREPGDFDCGGHGV